MESNNCRKNYCINGRNCRLESRFEDHDTGNLRTAVSVLKNRVLELKDRVHG